MLPLPPPSHLNNASSYPRFVTGEYITEWRGHGKAVYIEPALGEVQYTSVGRMALGTDRAFTQLGTGPWSIMYMIALSYCNISIVSNALGSAFLAPNVPYKCIHPSEVTQQKQQDPAAVTTPNILSLARLATSTLSPQLPPSAYLDLAANNHTDECTYESKGVEGETVVKKCTEWQFDNSTFESTITSEFNLVCERSYLRTSYQSLYMFGVFVGAPVNGYLADKFGRRMVLMVGILLYAVMTPAIAWLPHLPLLLFSRFLLGIFHSILSFTSYILAVEVVEPKYRTVTGFTIMLGWAAGIMLFGALAYLERSWRLLQTFGSLSNLLLLPFVLVMDESPRWLMVKGRREDAIRIFRKAARWHRVSLPSDQELLPLNDESPSPKKVSDEKKTDNSVFNLVMDEVLALLRTPRLRIITLLLYIAYLVSAMVYYGLSLSGGDLSENPFIYMVLSGLVEVPAYTLLIPIVQRAGRRIPGFICFLFCALALFALVIIPTEYSGVIMALALMGKVGITGAFQVIIFFSSELFPTEVRSRGVGTCFMMSRIGSILSPIIMDVVGNHYKWAPSLVFGAVSLVAAFAIFLLPETLGLALPDTISDLENRNPTEERQSRCWSLMRRQRVQEESKQDTTKEDHSPLV
ncbi:hypothetical protein Pcinc_014219 [Petrolisthes cinctipes]|uniref:Major facilitator superfamily (MFS) profile domain-containing protein n=1 Tax=Petrolisthes cinctipes TaxID=88211 RepID=A0AAE1KS05_PETCI|nr:hypothetical protein Pcinc_014219 [Petrolisthes cinctipes]